MNTYLISFINKKWHFAMSHKQDNAVQHKTKKPKKNTQLIPHLFHQLYQRGIFISIIQLWCCFHVSPKPCFAFQPHDSEFQNLCFIQFSSEFSGWRKLECQGENFQTFLLSPNSLSIAGLEPTSCDSWCSKGCT